MSLESVETFLKWLDEMEAQKGWTDYRLSVETGLSSSVFSKARQGTLPKWEALVRIAEALDVSAITAFRKAGLLPPGPANESVLEDWKDLLSRLSERDQAVLRQTALTMLQADKKGSISNSTQLHKASSKS